ncbi:MAG: hypothetical protein ACRESS_06310 [Stenotrophobium sp.]
MSKTHLELVRNNTAPAVIEVTEAKPHELISKAVIDRLAKLPASGKDHYIYDAEIRVLPRFHGRFSKG